MSGMAMTEDVELVGTQYRFEIKLQEYEEDGAYRKWEYRLEDILC